MKVPLCIQLRSFKTDRAHVHKNLAFAISVTQLLFLVGLNQTENKVNKSPPLPTPIIPRVTQIIQNKVNTSPPLPTTIIPHVTQIIQNKVNTSPSLSTTIIPHVTQIVQNNVNKSPPLPQTTIIPHVIFVYERSNLQSCPNCVGHFTFYAQFLECSFPPLPISPHPPYPLCNSVWQCGKRLSCQQHCIGGGGRSRLDVGAVFIFENLYHGRAMAICKNVSHRSGQDCRCAHRRGHCTKPLGLYLCREFARRSPSGCTFSSWPRSAGCLCRDGICTMFSSGSSVQKRKAFWSDITFWATVRGNCLSCLVVELN